ncbi:DUF89 domain-containing protein, partial [Pontiella sp.]|uniref:damage-control phosphatase ARMT1 family protein n=1 Tax=Pontiella sp. TaxID=2837462 RepID=UPI003569F55D
NIIDFGTPHGQKDNGLLEVIAHALEADLGMEAFAAFREKIEKAELILYLADNCGEAVMDRLLIEQLPTEKVVYAVRGKPILNDITPAELPQTGIDQLCRTMENGSDAPGTILELCSPEFRDVFARADLLIAKGQGNFETLNRARPDIFFLLKVKCDVVACETGLPLGSIVFTT